ncbi:MAG TPA: 4'-phosphopantetheinyl transferase superfamily protein [Candidatus Limnocylindrales bacterium]|nr:4'-phosphopantetheinyl transferase superfamily protein [Candidatus Limnocylindrales bacterium]
MPQQLKENRIDLWFAFTDHLLPEKERFAAWLSPQETERAGSFRFDRDRGRYIVEHGILRLLLAGYVGVEPQAVAFHSGPHGKPYLSWMIGRRLPHFSLSSSDGHAAFAFSRSSGIGVDIEKIRDIEEMESIALRHFTPSEKALVLGDTEEGRVRRFYRVWTRKEAVLKAHGIGLLREMDRVDVGGAVGTGPWTVVLDDESGRVEYTVFDIDEVDGFAAAVVVAGPASEISVRHYEL